MTSAPPPPVPPPYGDVPPPQALPPARVPWYRNSTIIAALIPTVIFGGITVWQNGQNNESNAKSADMASSGEAREKRDEDKEKAIAAGPPVSITAGESEWLPVQYVFPQPTRNLGEMDGHAKWDAKYGEWLRKNQARPIGLYSVRLTIAALRDETTIIQDFKLKDRDCPNTVHNTVEDALNAPPNIHGTLVDPLPVGGSGEDVQRTVIGFEVSQYDTVARSVWKGYPEPITSDTGMTGYEIKFGKRVSERPVVLEQKDARTFDIYFASGADCTFGVEVNVTSGSDDVWIPLKVGAFGQLRASIGGGHSSYETFARPKPSGRGMELANPKEGYVPVIEVTGDDVSPGA
ncbi:hypothetical protein [Streptomyces sp. NPDC046712]|uniref:hypothetical protein n=1 Tax=Streptomyces sp. NPDC046712 TaxID=3154802 RepID=UPI0033C1071F